MEIGLWLKIFLDVTVYPAKKPHDQQFLALTESLCTRPGYDFRVERGFFSNESMENADHIDDPFQPLVAASSVYLDKWSNVWFSVQVCGIFLSIFMKFIMCFKPVNSLCTQLRKDFG